MTKSSVAREYRAKFPKKPTLALARIVYSKNKPLYDNIEDARKWLRYIEGKSGSKDRKSVRKSPFVKSEARPLNPYKLPESDEAAYEPYVFKGHKRIAIFNDIHVPYHNVEAVTAAISFCKKDKPDALLLNGDMLDFHRISRFQTDPRKKSFKQELDTFKALIEVFEKQLKCKIYFKLGNHDERYENYLMQKAGELVGVEEFEFENIIKARINGIEIIGGKRIMKLNRLRGIHGHEYIGGISAPVNVARGLYLRGKVSAFQGHNHSSSSHSENNMDGKVITTWSVGCLCELHPAYMPLNKWNHGFAIVDLDENGQDFLFRNKLIYNGKVF